MLFDCGQAGDLAGVWDLLGVSCRGIFVLLGMVRVWVRTRWNVTQVSWIGVRLW